MKARPSIKLALEAAIALVILALAGCGSTPSASGVSPSPAAAKAPCTTAAVLVPIRAKYDSAQSKVTLPSNSNFACVSPYAKITIFIVAVPTPSSGPLGATHLVLLEDQSGQWVIANQLLCDSLGQPVKPLPAKLGKVCGVQ